MYTLTFLFAQGIGDLLFDDIYENLIVLLKL